MYPVPQFDQTIKYFIEYINIFNIIEYINILLTCLTCFDTTLKNNV